MRRPVGCLFPMCACIETRLGCAHEEYDMKESHNDDDFDYVSWATKESCDEYDESFGG
jgi:hypothetical protein